MKRSIFSIFILLISLHAGATQAVKYAISFPNAVHHEAEVSIEIPASATKTIIRMSRSSPGRYATHEFGKNVYNVRAQFKNGSPAVIEQLDGDTYQLNKTSAPVKVSYTVFGDWVDGTYLAIDETHAHINMPATFMWVQGWDELPIEITFNDLDTYTWKVATQLKPTAQPSVFTARNLQYFMDCPVELSAHKITVWKDVNPGSRTQQIGLAVHTTDDQNVVDNYAKMIERTVQEAKMVFGELATFDGGTYTFLQDINSLNASDGMEHRNSTMITENSERIAGNENDLLGTISHEFFHSWNVERIRPKSLEPFKFDHANISSELWLAEGFTQYYGELILKRAGFRTEQEYYKTLGNFLNFVSNAPGAKKYSPIQNSRMAVFTDAGVAIDRKNFQNIFATYYFYGAATALALDLRLRSEFGKTLDDYMRVLWKNHGRPEIPYTIADLQKALSSLTNERFASDFFKNYIYGSSKNDYVSLLAKAGLSLQKTFPGKVTLGPLSVKLENNQVKVASNTIEGTSAYAAGLENDDFLLKIGDADVKTVADVSNLIANNKPGDEVTLTFEHRGVVKTVKIKLNEDDRLEVIALPETTAIQNQFRAKWLSSKIKN